MVMKWTRDEEQILREYYFSLPPNIMSKLLPNRTWKAIKEKARQLGLYRFHRKVYGRSSKEIDEEYVAGMFDADGCIALGVGKLTGKTVGYHLLPIVDISQKYIAGLFDGEGCISASPFREGNRFTFRTKLELLLRCKPYDVLYEIKDFLMRKGIKATVHKGPGNPGEQLILRVSSLVGVKRFLELVLPYLRVKRPQALIMLKEIIPRMERGEHLTKAGFLELMKLADLLTILKGNTPDLKKYNYNYFRRLWSDL